MIMRKISKLLLGAALSFGVAAGAVGGFVDQAKAAWAPKKPVEFIIMAGTGGGADQIARLLQGLIEKKKLSPRPFIPINKPGGSGAEALRYLKDKAGDNHKVLVTLNSFYTTPHGLLAQHHGTDSSMYPSVVFGIPGSAWYDEGTVRTYLADLDNSRRMIYSSARLAKASVQAALEEAGRTPADVSFFAAHQPSRWFRPLTQEVSGLDRARFEDTFADYANCVACNLPLVLDQGRARGSLRSGDTVVLFSAAPGIKWTASVLIWA